MSAALECLFPPLGTADASTVVQRLAAARCGLQPFSEQAVETLRLLAEEIPTLTEAARRPELQALAFWLRPAAVHRWRQAWLDLQHPGVVLAPRGLVLHLPPANVDLQFAYGWVFALLAGNASLIRLSERRSEPAEALCGLFARLHREHEELELDRHLAVVAYPHDDAVTGELSAAADMRVLWGGDQTIEKLRRISIPARAVELTFPDRRSLCVVDVETYLQLSGDEARALAEGFFNDAYWYDQMACSSPQLLLWCASEAARADAASRKFFSELEAVIAARGYRVATSVALDKQLAACRAALDLPVARVNHHGNELVTVVLERPLAPHASACGGGFFFEARIDGLDDVVPLVARTHQTITHFGFREEALRRLVQILGAAGVQRVVPIGQALDFERHWDGYDLLGAFSRRVVVRSLGRS